MPKELDKPVVGVDLGGTKVLAGVIAPGGKLLGTAKRATRAEAGVEVVVERIVKTTRDAVKASGLEMKDIAGVCSGAPGVLNPELGIVRYAPNMAGWDEIPFASLLSEALGDVTVFIENDANLGILGEHVMGAAKGLQDVVGIFVGTGIGGGLILGGDVWQGAHKTAAEIGHMVLLAEGPVCGCGNRGCVEALASRTAIERDLQLGVRAGRESSIAEAVHRGERLTGGVLATAFRGGDPLVCEVVGRAQHYLGLLVGSIINFVDPEMVVIGGGVAEAIGEDFVTPMRPVAYQHVTNKRDARSVQIALAKLGDLSAVFGAAEYARRRLTARR